MGLDGLGSVDADIKVVQHTTVEQMVERILGERLKFNRERKLTWNDKSRPKTPGDRRIGRDGLDRRLEYHAIGRNMWFVQNGKIYDGGGKRKTLDEVDVFWKPFVTEIYENHKKQALAADDSLCPRCFEHGETFVAMTHEEYMDHNLDKHPEVVSGRLEALPKPKAAEVKAAPVEAPVKTIDFQNSPNVTFNVKTLEKVPDAAANFLCNACGKMAKSEHGLKIHTARIHKG